MITSLDCLPCVVKQAVESSRLVTKDEKAISFIIQKIFAKLTSFDLSVTPRNWCKPCMPLFAES